MTYAPPSLVELGRYWESHGGVNLGIVGDARHTKGYHLGRDRIYDGSGPGLGDDDYSVKLNRDKAGLTNGAAAIDLGALHGSLSALHDFSRWLVEACQSGAPGSRDVREVIYSPDGRTVRRYSGVDGIDREGGGDSSHLSHTHVSYFRDSEARSKTELFAPYLEDPNMAAVTWYPITGEGEGEVTLKAGRGLVDLVTGRRYVPDDTVKNSHARISAVDVGSGFLVRDAGHGCLALDEAVERFVPRDPSEPDLKRYVVTITADAMGDTFAIHATQDGEPIE